MRRVPTVTMRITEGQHGGLHGRVGAGGFPARAIHFCTCGIRMGRMRALGGCGLSLSDRAGYWLAPVRLRQRTAGGSRHRRLPVLPARGICVWRKDRPGGR